ncbi:MAG: hypothetical protein KC501_10720, partial [Myxococcales bacterium]|nr:hypothetical protein [Myxococcales bacterium]
AERALAVGEAELPAVVRARAQWVLVRARGLDPRRRAEAVAEARRLREAIDRLGPAQRGWRDEVDAWLGASEAAAARGR